MNRTDYFALADELARESGVKREFHDSMFVMQRERLWMTLSHFHVWDLRGKNVLEIGAFYSYTPFILRQNGNTVTVVEGDDPITYPLKPMYARRGIGLVFADLTASFGNPDVTKHKLPFPDSHFDVIICWETMEHFNFNPVGVVKEMRRLLKRGGFAALTVPNRARLNHRVQMAMGRPIGVSIESYYTFYSHPGHFFGWHWREYTMKEFSELFARENFTVESAEYLTYFMNRPNTSCVRSICESIIRLVCKVFPSCGSVCALMVRK
jgi:SAM-dependent methyltransferase